MQQRHLQSLAGLMLVGILGCGGSPDGTAADEARSAVSVSNPYLATVVRELVEEDFALVSLAEPGMCPGHFDLRPSLVREAARCRLLLRFDFQHLLDARLQAAGDRSPRIATIHVEGGLCEPESFVAACRQVADVLVAEGFLTHEAAAQRLAAVAARMAELDAWARREVATAGLAGAHVLASRHQEAFCRRLGLEVAATFPAAEALVPSQIDQAVQQGQSADVRLIVANRPEGRQAADALADRFDAPVVVFDNFPAATEAQAFDRMVHDNVAALVKAAGR